MKLRTARKTLVLPLALALCAAAFLSFAAPFQSRAASLNPFDQTQTGYEPLAPIPGTYDTATGKTDLSTYLVGIFKVGVAAAGVLAFLVIVLGGFTYLSTDSITGKEEGKHYVTRALGGLLLALASYIILNTINPQFVKLDLNFGTRANPGTGLGAPGDLAPQTNAEAYGKFLDESLASVNKISTTAKDIKAKGDFIEKQIEEGNYGTAEEGQKLVEKLKQLRKDETNVRQYENTSNEVNIKLNQMNYCLTGKGICDRPGFVRSITGFRSAAEIAADQEQARLQLEGIRGDVTAAAQKLETAGLATQASDLRAKLDRSERQFSFWEQCPAAEVFIANWKPGDNCP